MGSKNEGVKKETEEKPQKTMSSIKVEDSKFDPNLPTNSFCKLLEGVVQAANSAVSAHNTLNFQEQFGMSHQEALEKFTCKTVQPAPIHPNTELLDVSATRLIEQAPRAQNVSLYVLPKVERIQAFEGQDHVQKGINAKSIVEEIPDTPSKSVTPSSFSNLLSAQEKKNKPDSNEAVDDVSKTPKLDGYGWRKYGQKQVKSSGSSRSYYRCTNLSCSAKKKVEHSDVSGEVIDVVFKGNHNHDPPENLNKSYSRKKVFSNSLVVKHDNLHLLSSGIEQGPVLQLTYECDANIVSTVETSKRAEVEDLHSKIPDVAARFEIEPIVSPTEAVPVRSCSSNEHKMIDTMKERDVPFKKRRIKERGKSCSGPVYRTFKEPEVLVQPAGDAGLSSDGYRWRKYGQKMVKGKVHPRSYYRCSSAGCPVRKHVERATDGSLAIVAIYEGKHNHEMPAPRKQHGSPKPSVASSTGESSNASLPKAEVKPPSLGEHQDKNLGGDLMVLGALSDKKKEPTQTLVSVGIELKSC